MSPRRAGCALLALVAWVMSGAASAPAQTSSVLEGGFRLRNRERGQDAAVLSLGPLLAAGTRERSSLNDGGRIVCEEIVYLALGAKGTKRASQKLLLRQAADVVVFFVFYECNQDLDEICVLRASKPVAVPRCATLLTVARGGGVTGKVKMSCKDGVNAADAAFGLEAQQLAWLDATFPSLGRRFAIKFRDQGGEEVTGQRLKDKIQNLDADALDDVVGTFLADDNLPLCP